MAHTDAPLDRFDDIPDDLVRTGAHRAPARRGRGWIAFAWAALATGLLVAAGVVALSAFSDRVNLELPFETGAATTSESPDVAVTPLLDPAIAISVLNGTTTQGLANTVGDDLVEQGWGGAALGVGSRANAGANDVAATVVYYTDAANEAAALALVESLGVGEVRLSPDYPANPITVLLGSDYSAG